MASVTEDLSGLVTSSGNGVSFNQDVSSLTTLTKNGYKFYSLNSNNILETIFETSADQVLFAERLYSSSLIAVVSAVSPCQIRLYDFRKGTEICNYTYPGHILNVKLNRLTWRITHYDILMSDGRICKDEGTQRRLVVCLETSVYIHHMRDMLLLHTISGTPSNALGLLALSDCLDGDRCYLAYPGGNHPGEVHIFDAGNLKPVSTITAHDNKLVAMAFTSKGNWIATASEKGTVIRVFSVVDGLKLFEFRRGVKRYADIYSLAFSCDSLYLSCSSNTETVHVFKLEMPKDNETESETQSWYGYFNQALKTTTQYLPSTVSEVLTQGRHFAVARLPVSGARNVCAVTLEEESAPRLLVASEDGTLYIYSFDPQTGGECLQDGQHRIDSLLDTKPAERPNSTSPSSGPASRSKTLSNAPSQSSLESYSSCSSGVVTLHPRRSYSSVLQQACARDGPQEERWDEQRAADIQDAIAANDCINPEACGPRGCGANDELRIADLNEFPAFNCHMTSG